MPAGGVEFPVMGWEHRRGRKRRRDWRRHLCDTGLQPSWPHLSCRGSSRRRCGASCPIASSIATGRGPGCVNLAGASGGDDVPHCRSMPRRRHRHRHRPGACRLPRETGTIRESRAEERRGPAGGQSHRPARGQISRHYQVGLRPGASHPNGPHPHRATPFPGHPGESG